ncbi:MAG TPA: DUF5666 domain-containing protein [Candidatus Angelobacter sp.]|nr:DUF5666 domain-containing protein [Candidatus Angelobacter sp.]
MKKLLLLGIWIALVALSAWAQPQERRNLPPGDNVFGKVTSVSKDSLVLAPLMGGDPVTVKISENTRLTKERQPVKLEEIKSDDVVFARGNLNGNVMEAAMVGVVNPQMVQRFEQGGGPGGGRGPGGFNREDLGKKFIAGEVKAINETKLTIARPDGQNQDIEVDENTSFKKGNESITLPDIKPGDFVRGQGELKNGVFVPKELIVGRGQLRIMTAGPENPPQNPPAEKPSTPPPPK